MSVRAEQRPARIAVVRGGKLWLAAHGRTMARMARSPRASAWPQRYSMCLRVADVAVILAVVVCAIMAIDSSPRTIIPLAVLSVLWPAVLGLFGSRDRSVVGLGVEEYRRVFDATLRLFVAIIVGAAFLVGMLPALGFLMAFGVGTPVLLAVRWMCRQWLEGQRYEGLCLTTVIVVGKPEDVARMVRRIAANRRAPYDVLGAAIPGGQRGESLVAGASSVPVLGRVEDVLQLVALKKAAAVVVAGPVSSGAGYLRRLGWDLGRRDVDLLLTPVLAGSLGAGRSWLPVEGLPLAEVGGRRSLQTRAMEKRAFDIVFSAVALIVLAPLFGALAVLTWAGSSGRDRLVALHELVRVLRGEMSMVGPRRVLSGGAARICPGITSPWSGSSADVPGEDAFGMHLWYLENWSVVGDVAILGRAAFRAVAGRDYP